MTMGDLTQGEASAWFDLIAHWDTAYNFSFDGAVFLASRMDGSGHELVAVSPGALREAIRQDYLEWGLSIAHERIRLR
jgi:hypothetical protein